MKHLLFSTVFVVGVFADGYANLELGNAKEKRHQQLEKEQQVDKLNDQAKDYFRLEDSLKPAIAILKESYFIADQANYIPGIIKSSNLLGRGYLNNAEYSKATMKFYTSMRFAESIGDSGSVSDAYWGLGLVMYNMNNWSNAINNFQKSKEYNVKIKSSRSFLLVEYLLGLCYYNLDQFNLAEEYLNRSNQTAEILNDSMRLLEIRLYLNHIAVERYNEPHVIDEYDRLIYQFGEMNEKVGICYALEGKARSFLKSGDYKKASDNALKSLKLARNIELKYTLHSILDIVIKSEYQSGEYKSASDHMIELQQLRESTIGENTSTEVAMSTAEYDFKKKEAIFDSQLEEKNKQRLLLIILAIAFFIIALAIFLSWRGVAKERHRSDELLYNILPVETAKELKQTGQAIAKAHAKVTIVFADVENFTRIAAKLEPQDLVKMLDYYFSKFDLIIQKIGLEKIKTIGDAYMFVGGLHTEGEHHASKAVDASLLMLSAINEASEQMLLEFGAEFKFRMGMHTGKAVSGVVGTIKYAFDVWGDSVNIAARMEANSEPGKLNITEDTYKLVNEDYECLPRGQIDVKNKGNMRMFFVVGKHQPANQSIPLVV